MNVPGLPNLPAPSPNMVENWRMTGYHTDNSWRYEPSKYEAINRNVVNFEPINMNLPETPILHRTFYPYDEDRRF